MLTTMSDHAPADARAKRVLGVDPGLKRTGLALSDPLGISVRALDNLQATSRQAAVDGLLALAAEHEVEAIAIGHPVMPQSEDEGPMAKRARGLAEAVAAAASARAIAVFLVDERGTSATAAERLAASGVKRSKRKAALDSEAARVIVESFLAGDPAERIG
jgi:putative Holliday junction resolvase